VTYTYTEMAGGANHSRLTAVTAFSVYPELYGYGSAGSLDDRLSRVSRVTADNLIEMVTYLGLGTPVMLAFQEPSVKLTSDRGKRDY
jgi:hypothetical protein